MGKGSFYPRLALVNLTRNGQFYLPYLLSCGGTACMYYIVVYLTHSQIIANVRGAEYIQTLMMLGTIVVALFSVVLTLYANNFVMKRRRRELGLYNVLGMEKRHIAHLMLWETLLCALTAIAGGIVAGILFSKLILLILLRAVRIGVQFGYEISPEGIVQTIILFGVLFLLTLLVNLVRIGRTRPIELLHSDSAGEREPRVKWPLVVIGLAALLGGYYLSITVQDPISAMLFFFVAVILVIIGTLCLFTAGSIAALKALRRNKGFYYKPQHFTAVSGMLYRMKQNAVGLANICILSTMVLVTVSTTVSLYLGLDGMLNKMYPADIQVSQTLGMVSDRIYAADPDEILIQAEDSIAKTGRTVTSRAYATTARSSAVYSGNRLLFDPEKAEGNFTGVQLVIVTAEEYAHLSGDRVSLNRDEVLAYTTLPDLPNTFFIEGQPYGIAEGLDSFLDESTAFYTNMETLCLVVADEATLQSIAALDSEGEFLRTFRAYYDLDGTDEEKLACAEALLLGSNGQYSVNSRQENAVEMYSMYGGFLFLGLFLGILFLAATVLIIYYKQISEGYEDRRRFEIMQQVGMSRREVRRSINSQVLLVFFLPLAVAALHIAMAFPMIRKLLELFSLTNVPLFIACTLGTLLAFSIIYAFVYSLTAKSYYKIVRSA